MVSKAISYRVIIFFICTVCFGTMKGMSFDLDSIASKGKFTKFCVETYRWGDRFFNSYDTTFVKGTGYIMNIKLRSNNWFDYNNIYFPQKGNIEMNSPTTNTIGFDVTYMAVSLGYDLNINKLFGGCDRTKSKFNFDFSCALLTASFYSIKNDMGMNLTEYNDRKLNKIKFQGVTTSEWGIEANYFFNNKKYSYAAAFSLSRLQLKSQGSFSVGLSYVNQNYKFDFSQLPKELNYMGPELYSFRGQSFGLKIGYSYNWVPWNKITVGISESIVPAIVIGKSENGQRCSFRLSNRLNFSLIWNHDRWFIGAIGKTDIAIIYDRNSALTNGIFSTEIKFGWRFRL